MAKTEKPLTLTKSEVRSQKSEVRSSSLRCGAIAQKFVFETGIYAPLQKRFPLKGEALNPIVLVNQSEEFSHGRCVSRKVSVFDGQNVNSKSYPHLQSLIEVERTSNRPVFAVKKSLK